MTQKIVIIDDEQDILNILKRFLTRDKNLEIEIFSNPNTAYNSIMNNLYHLIILDIMMPQVNGLDLLQEIKKNNIVSKVILMTADATPESINRAHELGADDYILKPFYSLKDVESKILNVL